MSQQQKGPAGWVRTWVRLSLRFYLVFLLLAAGLVAWSTPRTLELYKHINTDLVALLPKNYPVVQELFRIREKSDQGTELNIIIEGTTPAAALSLMQDLAGTLSKDANFIVSTEKIGYDFLKAHRLLLVELEDLQSIERQIDRKIEQEKLGSLYIDFGSEEPGAMSIEKLEENYQKQVGGLADSKYYRNATGMIYAFAVASTNKDRGLKFSRQFVQMVQSSVAAWEKSPREQKPVGIYFDGKAINQVSEYESLMHDLAIAGTVSGLGILFLLLFYFRSFVAPVLAFVPMLIGLVLSFSVARFWIDELNIVTSFLYSVLSGLGIENGIHFVARYRLERQHGASIEDALGAVVSKTGYSIGFSVASVSLIFFSLLFNDFKGFSQFGLIAGLGLLCVYFCYLMFFAPLVVLLEKLKLLRVPHNTIKHHTDRRGRASGFLRPVLWSSAIAAIFSCWVLIAQPLFNFDLTHLRAHLPELVLAKQKRSETTQSGAGPTRVIVHSEAEANALKKAVRKIINEQGEVKRIDSFFSYYDLFPKDQPARLAVLKEIERKLDDPALKLASNERQQDIARIRDELQDLRAIVAREIPQDLLNRFKGESGDGVYALIQPNKQISLDDGKNGLELLNMIGAIQTPEKTFYPASDPLIYASVLKTMLKDAPKAIGLAALIVIALILLDVRSLKTTLLITVPIFLGELWLLGGMWCFGMKLDFYNMVIVPVVIGMSIDNCIHIYHRFEELGRANLRKVLQTAGLASAVASSTNALGFLGLAFTNHGGLASLGKMAVLGLGTTLFSTVVFLPALLALKKHQ